MNREILFRGRSFSDGSWVYGNLEYERNKGLLGKVRIHTYKEDGSYDRQHLVESDTIGQFTGLRDKSGREIYEGDIVVRHEIAFGRDSLGTVRYDLDKAMFVLFCKKVYGI